MYLQSTVYSTVYVFSTIYIVQYGTVYVYT